MLPPETPPATGPASGGPQPAVPAVPAPVTPPKPLPTPPPPRRPKLRGCGCFVPAAILMLLAVFIWASPWFTSDERPAGAEPVVVVIQSGDTLGSAADRLQEAGIISSSTRFSLLARLLGGGGGNIQAGEFSFYATDNWSRHLETLTGGRAVHRQVVIPEGMPSVLVHERLMAAPYLTGSIDVPAEGSVLPATYSYERGESRQAVLERMQAAMRDELARLWADRNPQTSIVRTPEEAVILASIVEKETAKASERRTIAGVYTNRLRIDMPLQADPTVIYPVTRGRALGRRILRSELRADNGYNTYARRGLPVGPIANPGREAIAAVLNPEPTRALYFVADGSGGHAFAETLQQHEANVQRWYALRRQRGEMN